MLREVISDPRIIARFMRFVEKGDGPDDCWKWTGAAVFAKGYGRFKAGNEGTRPAQVPTPVLWAAVDAHEA